VKAKMPAIRIVHLIPGRARFKLDSPKRSRRYIDEIQRHLSNFPWVQEVRINPALGSLIVQYDSESIAAAEFLQTMARIFDVSPDMFAGVFKDLAASADATPPVCDVVVALDILPPDESTLYDASVVHAFAGRARLRVRALKTCSDLAGRLEEFIRNQTGVLEVSVSSWSASITVTYDTVVWTSDRLCGWVRGLKIEVVLEHKPPAPREDTSGNELWYSSIGIGLMLLAGQFAAPLAPILLLAAALPMLKRAHRSLVKDRRLNVDVLDASATSLLVIQSNFTMALFMVWLINVADLIRDRTMMRSRKAIEEILGYHHIEAWVVRHGQKIRVNVSEVLVGETVVVYPGERIAVDGTVLSGKALVDQSSLTGESVPVEREIGGAVLASTTVREGKLYVRADRIGSETEAANILRLVDSAPARETKIQNYAVKWANDIVPYSFLGAAVGTFTGGGLQGAAAVLIIDYGTGIRIAAPTTVLSAMTKAIRSGILVKGGRHLESLAEVDAVVFDKTGTLTMGQPGVELVVALGSSTPEDVLGLAAAAELRLSHPVAAAIVAEAEARGVTIPERTSSDYAIGLGVEAMINESMVLVGSPRFMVQRGLELTPEVRQHIESMQQRAISPQCVARDGIVIGLLGICDPLRPEARAVVRALRDRGVKRIVMLTGDHRDVARRVAAELGITEYVAEVFPGDKSESVQRLQAEGYKVAVIGDGINDSPMLAYADVGIAVEGGTEAARETAAVVLLHGGLWKVPLALDIGRETVALIKQNWQIILIPNTFALALATLGLMGPIGATILSNGSAIVATLNGLRPTMQQKNTAPLEPVRQVGQPP